jgi:hypothetical protein
MMPLVLDELCAYFATIRKFQTLMHFRSANRYIDIEDEEGGMIWRPPPGDRLLPSALSGATRSSYTYDDTDNSYQIIYDNAHLLRFQDARYIIEALVRHFGEPLQRRDPLPHILDRHGPVRLTRTYRDVQIRA